MILPRLLAVLAVVLGAVVLPVSAASGVDTDDPAAQQLVDRFSPVVKVRAYEELCDDDGEPYLPMSVDPVLDNPQVALRQVGNGDAVIRWAPSAADLYRMGPGTYLDLPGDALDPGCICATDSVSHVSPDTSSVYAHVVGEAERPGYLAVQYWLYFYFNDWNDKHEGDWEFVQLLFKADSVEEALRSEPVSAAYAQHEGGEEHAWDSPDLRKVGDHPVVYTSENSHASYFAPGLYLGRGASEGFGCDNTQGPSTTLEPRAILLADQPSGPDDPQAWLTYPGRWGQRESGPNNGPAGPGGKARWTEPLTWQDGMRPSSFVIPGGSAAPPKVIGQFCSVVGAGSVLFVEFAANPAKILIGAAVLALVVWWLLGRTVWSAVETSPVVARRRGGQLVRAAADIYRRHPREFVAMGLLAVPVGVVAVLLTAIGRLLPGVGTAVQVVTEDTTLPAAPTLVSSGVATALWPVTIVLVSAGVAHLLHDAEQRGLWSLSAAADAGRAVWARRRALVSAYLPAALLIFVLTLSVIGWPIAVWLAVRWQFVGQAVMIEGRSGVAALRRSTALTRGRWWHTAVFGGAIWFVIHGLGVLVGLVLLITFTSLPLWSISLVMLLAEVALAPLGAIILTLLYGDAVAESQADEPVAA